MNPSRMIPAALTVLLALGAPGVRPAAAQPTATYVPFPATPGNILVGDVDLTPRIVPGTGFAAVSYLPTRGALLCVNSVTNTIAATVPLPSPSVRGIDPQFTADATKMVVMSVGHLSFYDVTVTPPLLLATLMNSDTPISDCDPQVVNLAGVDYCIVPYVGSVRVLSIGAGGLITDLYTLPRTSVGLDAVDPVVLGAAVFVPNVTTVDCFSLPTGAFLGSTVNAFLPKREIDMVPMPALGKVYWPLEGGVIRYDPFVPGLVDALIPIPGATVEGVDMGVLTNAAYPAGLGAFPTTGFLNLIDLGAGTLISACPTPGAVVRNFDPLMTNWNLTGAADGLVYWSVIGSTYAVDLSVPFAPFATIPTPGGLTDGVDLTASNNLARAVLPHPGFVHVINLPTATLVGGGIIPTPGTLKVDVDPLFPTTPAVVAIGTKVVQPYLGGLLIVGGLSGSPNQCLMTTTPTLYVLNLATMSVTSAFALGPIVSGVDPVLAQGVTSPFDDNPESVRDRDQDFLCNRAQMQPYWCRPWFLPYWPIRSPWWRAWGLPGLSQFDAWGRSKLEVLEDGRTVAVLKPNGQVSQLLTLNERVIGGAVYDRDWRYCKFYLRGNMEAIIDLTPFNIGMFVPQPIVKYVSFPGAVYWPPAHDYWNGYEILVTNQGADLCLVNSWTGVLTHAFALPARALFPPSMDYKNKLCSVLLRGNQRYILDMHAIVINGAAVPVTSQPVFRLSGFHHWRPMINTIYDPMNLCSLDLMYDPSFDRYALLASHAVTGDYLWHHILPYRPYGRIYVEKKSKLAKVPLHNGYEFLADLAPLAWGGVPRSTNLYIGHPWTYEPVWDYVNRWEINCHAPNVITVVDAYRFTLRATLFTPFPIIGPPVIDPMNKYLRVRLAGGYSYFVDLFKLHRGDADYTRLDHYGADLADDALFDPTGGYDLAVTTDMRLIISHARSGGIRQTLNLPAPLARPMLYDPHNRVAELLFQNGQMGMLDMSLCDESGNNAPFLQLANLPARPLSVADQTAPPAPSTAAIVVSSIGSDGVAEILAPAGTVEPNSYVALVNQTDDSVEPTEVMSDDLGGFRAGVPADSGEFVCVIAADVAANVSLPSCFMVQASTSAAPIGEGVAPAVQLAARPNPFRATLDITFTLPAAGDVAVEIYDVNGRIVRRIDRRRFDAGENRIAWDATDDAGAPVVGGVYFVRATTGGHSHVQRVVRMP